MKKTVIVTAIGSFSAQNVISACHKAGMRVVGCDIYPAEWVVNSRDVDVFYRAPYATGREQYRNFLKELCKKEQASVLMPLTDVEIDVIQQEDRTGGEFQNAGRRGLAFRCFCCQPLPE